MDTLEESAGRIVEAMAEAGRRQRRPMQFVVGKVLAAGEGVLRFPCSPSPGTAPAACPCIGT